MAEKTIPVLLVTANVGSIFEDPSVMLKVWTEEFLATVSKLDPKFIALHCQEVGGKNYEESMKHVEYFVRLLMSSEELRLFDKVRLFLDEDFSSAENFTALGNFYFIHESITDILIWDFKDLKFVPVDGKEIHSGNIEHITTKEKSKFPQDFFPECKWSRKGFLRTRWNLNGTMFDLINIHLFHDASNFVAMESFPSVYCKNRRRALEHTLDRFHSDANGTAPFFLFGDFNFRTNTRAVVDKLAEGLNPVGENTGHSKLQYKDDSSQIVFSVGKKEFSHQNHQAVFVDNDNMWLKTYDNELEPFAGRLFEFPIHFPPSYPFEESELGATRYMQTRCPSWCDRVILSSTAKSLVADMENVDYGLIGLTTCMGDHKPVYLRINVITGAGTVFCCTPQLGNVSCFLPDDARARSLWPCSKNTYLDTDHLFVPDTKTPVYLRSSCSNSDVDGHLLAPPHPSFLHEPYTPESVDTPSPSPIPSPVNVGFLHDTLEEKLNNISKLENTINGDRGERTENCDGGEPTDYMPHNSCNKDKSISSNVHNENARTHFKKSFSSDIIKFNEFNEEALEFAKFNSTKCLLESPQCKTVSCNLKTDMVPDVGDDTMPDADIISDKIELERFNSVRHVGSKHDEVASLNYSAVNLLVSSECSSWNEIKEDALDVSEISISGSSDLLSRSFHSSLETDRFMQDIDDADSKTLSEIINESDDLESKNVLLLKNDHCTKPNFRGSDSADTLRYDKVPLINSQSEESLKNCDVPIDFKTEGGSVSSLSESCDDDSQIGYNSQCRLLPTNHEQKLTPAINERQSEAKNYSQRSIFKCCTIV